MHLKLEEKLPETQKKSSKDRKNPIFGRRKKAWADVPLEKIAGFFNGPKKLGKFQATKFVH